MAKRKADTLQNETSIVKVKQTYLKSKTGKADEPSKKFSKKEGPPGKKFSKPSNDSDGQKQIFKKFQKKNVNTFQKIHNDKNLKPADWNEFKKKKKELRIKRRQSNSLFEVITKAKQIAETLRKKTLDGGKTERDKLVNELHQLLGGQGNYAKFVLTHDMARIVQYMLKFGNQQIRLQIASEIIPFTVQMLQSKYGRYCIKRLFKYGNTKLRSESIKTMYGNAVKLTSHNVSAHIFEYIYSTWTQPIEKIHLIQEYFGDLYKQSKDDNVRHLRDVYKNSPDMKNAALGATKINLSRVLNKDLLDSGLVQSVLYQYLTECSENDRNDLLTQLAPHAVILSNSKDGARIVMECIWNGTNKDKKVIMKAIKEHVLELCKHEHGHTVLIAIFDAIDDTVLVNKMLISEIVKNVLDIAKDEWGRKVILWLVAPAHSTYFHPAFTNELECGRQKSTSKKSMETRQKEILNYSSDVLLTSIKTDTKQWFESGSISMVALAILKSGSEQILSEALSKVAEMITDNEWKTKEGEETILGVEHAGLHMTLKKLIQNDKEAIQNNRPTFSKVLLHYLEDDIIKKWLKMNRSCFLLITVLENGDEDVVDKLKEKLKNRIKRITKGNTTGTKILLKKLT